MAERWKIARVWTSLDEMIADVGAQKVIYDVAIPPAVTLSLLERLPLAASVLMQKRWAPDWRRRGPSSTVVGGRDWSRQVNHQLRFAPYMLALRDAFQRGWLGAMTDVECN